MKQITYKPLIDDSILEEFDVHLVGAPSADDSKNLEWPLGPRDV